MQESTRASAVVKRVRALYRKEAQVREFADMNRLIQELARLLRDEAIRRGTSIRLLLARDLPKLAIDSGADSAGAAEPRHERHGCYDAEPWTTPTYNSVREMQRQRDPRGSRRPGSGHHFRYCGQHLRAVLQY